MRFNTHIFLCLILSGIPFLSYSQKVDFDKKKVSLQYIDPPQKNDLNKFTTYSVDFGADQASLNQLGIGPKMIEDLFKLEGFSYVPETGDILYSILIDKPVVIKEEVISKENNVKQADGSMKAVTEYFAVVQLSVPTVIQVLSNITGEPLYMDVFSTGSAPTTFESGAQATKEAAQKLLTYKDGGLSIYIRDIYKNQLIAAVKKFKRQHDYGRGSYTQDFFDVNINKAPELTKFHEEITVVTDALQKAPADQPLFATQMKLEPILSRWKEEAAKLPSGDKELKKLKFLYLYNLAVSQLWLELFDDALENCKLIKENDFKSFEATEIENNVKAIQNVLSKSGADSRHVYRPGFQSTARYTYTPQKIEKQKTNFVKKSIESTVQDYEAIKKSGQEIRQDFKEDFGKKVLGDTIDATNAMFSTLKVNIDGEQIEYKKRGLSTGEGRRSAEFDDGVYGIHCWKNDKVYDFVQKEGELNGLRMYFYSNKFTKETVKPEQVLDFLKNLKDGEMTDISTDSRFDSVPFSENGVKSKLKEITWSQYGKEFSADIEFSFHSNSRDGSYSFKTMNGAKFQVKLLESRPIVVKGNGGVCTQGYVVRLLIPEVVLTKLNYGHYVPMYAAKYKTAKDLEMFVIFR